MISLSSFLRQGEEIQTLIRQITEGTVVHALLITGEKGLGKRTLATLVAAGLLCKTKGTRPCGVCGSCIRALTFEHPDITVIRKGEPISPEVSKGRNTIPVDDIREMIRITGERTLEGGARVFLIFDADKMTPQAQNSLLKTLEEPPDSTYIILVTDHSENILTTIMSRCRTIRLKPWDHQYIMDILAQKGTDPARAKDAAEDAMGSIGKAMELASDEEYWKIRESVFDAFFRNSRRSDILRISNEWKERKGEADRLFEILETQIRTLIRYRFMQGNEELIHDYPENWKRWAREAEPDRFVTLTDAIREARKEHISNVNFQAVLEQLMIVFMGEGTKV